jgi:ABC-type uncharacterized transport system fused permease/ATPase subunit
MREAVRLAVEIDTGEDPIAGRVFTEAGKQSFTGWLGLISALEGAVTGAGPAGSGAAEHSTLLGRESETGRLRRLLADASAGEGGSLVIHGEPGVGKSALLRHVRETTEGFRLLTGGGGG